MTAEPVCPRCGGQVAYDLDCHTWQRSDGVWMSCLGCASATYYTCLADDCRWSYIAGLNPRNPRAAENESNKPPWDAPMHEDAPPPVPSLWEVDRG